MSTHTIRFFAPLTVILVSITAHAKRPVTPQDCVLTKYLLKQEGESALKINPQGTLVAYLVKVPNLQTNNNDIALYVRRLSGNTVPSIKLLTSTPNLSQIEWLADGRHLAALAPYRGHVAVVLFDVNTGGRKILASGQKDIDEYAINTHGDTLAFAVRAGTLTAPQHSPQEIANGYRIPNDSIPSLAMVWRSRWIPYQIWIRRLIRNGQWTSPTAVPFHSPFTGKLLESVRCATRFNLSLSPDGNRLLLNVADIDMAKGEEVDGSRLPEQWLQSPTYRRRAAIGGAIWLTVLQDLTSGETSMPIATPGATGVPQWSSNGSSFYIVATSPVGSTWEKTDDDLHPTISAPWHVWRVRPLEHKIEKVFSEVRDPANAILWTKQDSIGLRAGPDRLVEMVRNQTNWITRSDRHIGPSEGTGYGDLASNGVYTVMDYERSDVPPELRVYRNDDATLRGTSKLNPAFDDILLAQSETLRWNTSSGVPMTGSLLLPLGYVPRSRYPLVIQTKSNLSAFVCDAGSSHSPSFAPQPMASAGLMYLTLGEGDRNAPYPRGYPGNIAEAAFYTDIWDSAVQELNRRGMADPSRVGIIGFSRTGWHTEFALAFGKTHYAAATATDNIQYSLGEYWLAHSEAETGPMDAMYGGSPYGASLESWIRYSLSFNMDKIHTPLLIEVMGYGVLDDRNGASPDNLNPRYEILTGLSHLKKPVEMYYYPNEQHQPDHPQARLASIQRNMDWYRFWLQGYERPNPEDHDQFARWRELRLLRDADEAAKH